MKSHSASATPGGLFHPMRSLEPKDYPLDPRETFYLSPNKLSRLDREALHAYLTPNVIFAINEMAKLELPEISACLSTIEEKMGQEWQAFEATVLALLK